MNKFLSTVALVPLLVATPALAADFIEPEPPPGVVIQDDNLWDGFSIGVQAGWATATRDGCFDADFWFAGSPNVDCAEVDGWVDEFFAYDQQGPLIGAQANATFMFGEMFLLGAEVDASLTNIRGELTEDGYTDLSGDPEDDPTGGFGTWTHLATATGQIGFAIESFKVYAEGGVAIAGFNWDGNDGCDFQTTVSGLVAGVGAAAMVTDNVSVGVEYNHIWMQDDFNNCSVNTIIGPVNSQVQTDGEMDVFKLSANYHF